MTRKILKAYTENVQHQYQEIGRKKRNSPNKVDNAGGIDKNNGEWD